MPRTTKTASSSLTVDQAISRARIILQSGEQLQRAAQTASETVHQYGNRSSLSRAADELKEHQLLGYRVTTVPETLAPILEALIEAATANTPATEQNSTSISSTSESVHSPK